MKPDIIIQPTSEAERLEFDWGVLTWFASGSLGNAEALTLGRCVLNPRQANPRHYHPNCTEILVVLSGKIRHTSAGGGSQVLEPNDTVTIPPNVWHQAENLTDDEAVLLIAFDSAQRETVGE